MRTIGVLGGLGPQATMAFEARVHEAAQARIPQKFNTGYPPMVVYYFREPPLRLDAGDRPIDPPVPNPGLLAAAAGLGRLADFLVIPSNFPHTFQRELEDAAGLRVLSMIELTAAEVLRRPARRIGVLGLGEPTIYTSRLGEADIELETLSSESRAALDAAIFALMEGRRSAASAQVAADAVEELRARGAELVVLGCTEIPLLLGDLARAPDLVDPLGLLAEAAVAHACETPG